VGLLGRPVRPVPPPVPAGAGGPDVGPGRMLRRRPGPLQLALVGALVTLVFLVEVLILGAYVSSSEATAAYGKANSLTGNVTGAQRELGDALAARSGSERLLVGLSGLVLLVGVALALSLRQRVRSDFARAWQAVVAEAEERKQLEAQLVHQAYHDGLTGLANRTLFADRVQHALAGDGNEGVAVLFVDLDDFKHVNDSLGHDAGDQLLVAAAKRLESCLRATDTAARFGSDEFALLLEGVARPGGGVHRRLPGHRHAAPAVRPARQEHPDQGERRGGARPGPPGRR